MNWLQDVEPRRVRAELIDSLRRLVVILTVGRFQPLIDHVGGLELA